MSNWACNTAVTFRNGRAERRPLNNGSGDPEFLDFIRIPERNNAGGPFRVPGIRLGINFERPSYVQFSHGFGLWRQERLSEAEIAILQLINDLTEKKDWHSNVNDFSICQTWRDEAFTKHLTKFQVHISLMLWDWCLFELRMKGIKYKTRPGSFAILDSASQVRKSDKLMGTEILDSIEKEACDLDVSPWMYPYIFRHTPVRGDGVSVTLDNITDCIGKGEVPFRGYWECEKGYNGHRTFYSNKSQWLATDVKFIGDENDNAIRIISPINNLDPTEHRFLYSAVETIISDSISDWDQVLLYKTLPKGVSRIRPQLHRCLACFQGRIDSCTCTCEIKFRESSAWANDRLDNKKPDAWKESAWNPIMAMDGDYVNSRKIYDNVSLRKGFGQKGLQVYVEILKIEIESDGSISEENAPYFEWNLNGNRNERIVATTLVCLHRENIHPVSGGISLRTETKLNAWEDPGTKAKRMRPQGTNVSEDFSDSEDIRSRNPVTPSFQQLGTVMLPQGRTLTFPNALQHKFELPLLNDESRPGHIQLLQIHLVDPHYIVGSTRHVPPQSLKWWWKACRIDLLQRKHNLPIEVAGLIVDHFIGPNNVFLGEQHAERLNILPPQYREDGKLWRKAPIRRSTALRMRRKAIAKHGRVMKAVNGPRIYRPNVAELWLRDIGRLTATCDQSDEKDVLARPIPPPSPNATGPWDDDPTNAGEGSSRDREDGEDDDSEDEDSGSESEGPSEESDSEDNDSELGGSDPMDFEEELEEFDDGNVAGAADTGDSAADGEAAAAAAAVVVVAEAADVASPASEEFHDAVFYYFEGELEAMQQQDAQDAQDAQAAREEEEERQPQMDMFYDAPTVPYREDDDIEWSSSV